MDDYDIFTHEIEFTKPFYKDVLKKYVYEAPPTPIGPNYESGQKLLAEECMAENDEMGCAFHLSESVSATLRTMTVYRDEQLQAATANSLNKIISYIKPVQDLIVKHKTDNIPEEEQRMLDLLKIDDEEMADLLNECKINNEIPLHKRYMKFSKDNNVDNFKKILKELPKEWTIVQLTAPYNCKENFLSLEEYRKDIDAIYLSVFTNDYFDDADTPITVLIPANVHKEGEKPLFTELYSLLDDNYTTIDNAQYLNNKRLVKNYWSRREEIDLRMKSVINVMDKEWLGGWGSLLTGKLVDSTLKDRVKKLVDNTISDWGFIKLTKKQAIFLYNLIECCPNLLSQQIKPCIRRILTEHGNPDDVRRVLDTTDCKTCSKEFRFVNELCVKCLSKCFEKVHHFTLVDGIKAFSKIATLVKENEEWSELKTAKRFPVILIVDERLDTFPWESLPVINQHPVSRIENIHFLYSLYKIHEASIVDGYLVYTGDVGRYVINPEKNLERMEKRMSSFVQYWCKKWSGNVGESPSPDDFLKHLTDADIFLYCGHGDGCQFASGGAGGAGVEGVGVRAVCVLSGCGSVRLSTQAPRLPPGAAHHHLHIAACPMVIGMLWEVTDLEVDKMVTTLISLFVPSDAEAAWQSVGKTKWSQGILDTTVESKSPLTSERDLLRAVCASRRSTNFVMIASSMVARGIPVTIRER